MGPIQCLHLKPQQKKNQMCQTGHKLQQTFHFVASTIYHIYVNAHIYVNILLHFHVDL